MLAWGFFFVCLEARRMGRSRDWKVMGKARRDMRTYSTAKRIRQTRQRSRSNTSPLRKPHITIPRGRRQHKRLCQPGQHLSEHDDSKDTSIRLRPCIPDPVAHKQQHRRGNDTLFGASMQHIHDQRTCNDEGELETRRQPINRRFANAEVQR